MMVCRFSFATQRSCRGLFASRTFSTMAGTVKFYNREKAFGFIEPDGGGADIYVHRTGIISPLTAQESVSFPYLRQGERIRFNSVPSEGRNSAVQVTWLNGNPVPPLRRGFRAHNIERAKSVLGDQVYGILEDESMSPEEQYLKVLDAYAFAQSTVKNAEQLIVRMGMTVEEFPTDSRGWRQANSGRTRDSGRARDAAGEYEGSVTDDDTDDDNVVKDA